MIKLVPGKTCWLFSVVFVHSLQLKKEPKSKTKESVSGPSFLAMFYKVLMGRHGSWQQELLTDAGYPDQNKSVFVHLKRGRMLI